MSDVNDFINELAIDLSEHCNISAKELKELITFKTSDYYIQKQIVNMPHTTDGSTTLWLWSQYEQKLFAENKSEKTIEQYRINIRLLVSFAQKEVDMIETEDINAFYNYLRNFRNNSERSIFNKSASLKPFFIWMVDNHYIKTNPFIGAAKIHVIKEPKYALTSMEMELVRMAVEQDMNPKIRKRNMALIMLLLESGMRISEAISLNIEDLDFMNCSAKIKGKGNKVRTVYWGGKTVVRLEDYLKNRPDVTFDPIRGMMYAQGTPLFASIKKPYGRVCTNSIRHQLKDCQPRVGSKVHPHRLRRTMISTLSSMNYPLTTIAKAVGHSMVTTTQIYVDTREEDVKHAITSVF